jgi:molybdopterin molybdotransferase
MISLTEARRIITESVQPLPACSVPLAAAQGRVLADDAVADAFYPSGDRSMMDGYAIPLDAAPGEFRVTGEIQAGAIPQQALLTGDAVRIFTGALVPDGTGRVIPQELARRSGNLVTFAEFPAPKFIRPRGSEAAPGAVVLPAGTRLGPAELAILAQIGNVMPWVIGSPSIRHIATGGEIVAPDQAPSGGTIRDTNSTLLAALIADLGAPPLDSIRCGDDLELLSGLCQDGPDLLLISGGASVGDYDFGAEALRRGGFAIHFDKVNLRPGKPLTFATRGRQLAFVIPGNPVSHYVCFHVAIRLALELLRGQAPAWDFLDLELSGGETLRPDPRETFWPARVRAQSGRLVVTPQRWSTSGDTFSLAGTNALVRVNDAPPAGRVPTLLL